MSSSTASTDISGQTVSAAQASISQTDPGAATTTSPTDFGAQATTTSIAESVTSASIETTPAITTDSQTLPITTTTPTFPITTDSQTVPTTTASETFSPTTTSPAVQTTTVSPTFPITTTSQIVSTTTTSSFVSTLTTTTQTPHTTIPTTLQTTTRPSTSSSSTSTFSSMRTTTTTAVSSSSAAAALGPTPQKGLFLNTGVAVGAAVGCFVVGTILAAIVSFFLLRKRKRSRTLPASYISLGSTAKDLDSIEKYGSPVKSNAMAMDDLDFMSRQPDEATVRYRIQDLIQQIQSHVDSFYHDDAILISPALEAELSRFETSQLSAPLATCFSSSNRPTALIQHCIAFHIFNLTVAPGEGITPLIANELSGIVAANQYAAVTSSAPQSAVKAYSQWKGLTSYLLPHLTSDDGGPLPAEQVKTVARIASHFSNVFEPWSNKSYPDAHRTRHLVKLVEQAVRTATWLFSQTDCYKFEWTLPVDMIALNSHLSDGEQAVVVAPSMIKMTQGGEFLRNPIKMLDVIVETA